MHNELYSSCKHLYVDNSPSPYVGFSSAGSDNNQLAGTVRYNPSYGGLQVFNGNNWTTLSTMPTTVGMHQAAIDAIDWAMNKMKLEREAEALAETSPAVKAALENLARVTKELDIIVELTKEHDAKAA